jgi:hypothetical protein
MKIFNFQDFIDHFSERRPGIVRGFLQCVREISRSFIKGGHDWLFASAFKLIPNSDAALSAVLSVLTDHTQNMTYKVNRAKVQISAPGGVYRNKQGSFKQS